MEGRREYNKSLKALCIVLLFAISFVFSKENVYASSYNANSFQIDFIDVGQGDAELVQCDGHYMLVDGGDSKQSSLIYSYLKRKSIDYLDVMVATHPDADHIGGLSGALNYASVGAAYSPVTEYDTKAFQSFAKYLAKQGISITIPKAGDTFMLGSAKVTVLGPRTKSLEPNNNSIVLRIVYGNTSFLLTGDAETDEEISILNSGQTVKSNVLKVAHHGSNYSTGYRFLREVAPEYAVISVGADNQYGHPTENLLSRLRDAGVKTYRTDIQGDIICTSDGKKVSFTTEKNQNVNTLSGAGMGQKSDVQTIEPYENSGQSDVTRNMGIVDSSMASSGNTETESTYVINTNTHKFHRPDCKSVSQMKDKNKQYYSGTRDSVIAQGYDPCKNCNP